MRLSSSDQFIHTAITTNAPADTRRRSRVVPPGLALAVTLFTACTDATAPANLRVSPSLQRLVDSIATANRIPAVVVDVRRADGSGFTLTSGIADLKTGRRVQPTDRFRIASITKPMVATVVLQLVDEGRLALDVPIAALLPNVVPHADRITPRQLLNHTAGLPDYTNDEGFIAQIFADPGRTWTPQELLAIANRMPEIFAPGEVGRWAYSNTDYIVLGVLVERVTAMPLDAVLQSRVFDRLAMRRTLYSSTTALPRPFAQGYADIDETQRDVPVGTLVSPTWAGAAGAVVSTAGDLARFAEALASGALLSPASQAARLDGVPASTFRFAEDPFDSRYGLGVLIGDAWIGHNGAIPGYEAEAFAKVGVGSIGVVTNRTTDTGASHAILAAVRDAVFGQQD